MPKVSIPDVCFASMFPLPGECRNRYFISMLSNAERTRSSRLFDEIANAIVSGAFEPGSRLDEQSLATRFGVSRTPVREALRQLTTSGLIEMRPRRGVVVASLTKEKLHTLFVAMGEIEATCARLSALSMTPLERRALSVLCDSMERLVEDQDRVAYGDANILFHTRIYDGAHNPVLADFAHGLRKRLAPFRGAQFGAPGRMRQSYEEHIVITAAIQGGDAAAAHAAMLHHVSLVELAFDKLAGGG